MKSIREICIIIRILQLTEDDVKELLAAYYGQVKMIDDYIGKIIEELKAKDCYDNTVIIFTADHGDHLGEHGIFFKGQMYDSCAKVPLIIKGPMAIEKVNYKKQEVVNTLDLYATVLEYAGITEKQYMQKTSNSLHDMVEGNECDWDNTTYSIIGSDKNKALCMIRKDNMKLIRLAVDEKNAAYELYNMQENPEETCNMWGQDKYKNIANELKELLDVWYQNQASQYPC